MQDGKVALWEKSRGAGLEKDKARSDAASLRGSLPEGQPP